MKIYTRTGDMGETGVFGGPRTSKDDIRIEAYGTVDELNGLIGYVRAVPLPEALGAPLVQIQHDLFAVGAMLATPQPEGKDLPVVGDAQVERLEATIDELEEALEPLREFVLPSGGELAGRIHLARGVCRRAERRVVTLWKSVDSTAMAAQLVGDAVRYLNRLSDLLFVAARFANKAEGVEDLPWRKESESGS